MLTLHLLVQTRFGVERNDGSDGVHLILRIVVLLVEVVRCVVAPERDIQLHAAVGRDVEYGSLKLCVAFQVLTSLSILNIFYNVIEVVPSVDHYISSCERCPIGSKAAIHVCALRIALSLRQKILRFVARSPVHL